MPSMSSKLSSSALGAGYAIELAATAPQRVSALFLLGPTLADLSAPESAVPEEPQEAEEGPTARPVESPATGFHDRPTDPTDWGLYNAHVWRERFPDFVHFFPPGAQ